MFPLIRKANPKEDLRRQAVFAWAVVGLLLEQTIVLPLMANAIVSTAQAASRVRRLRRFLANPRVQVRSYYDGLIRAALTAWNEQTLYLALDTTSLAGRVVVARVAVIYRGRAVPLVWQVYERHCLSLAFADYQDLLEHAHTLLPPHARVVLLGDRSFRTKELMAWCRAHGWHYRLRLTSNQYVTLSDGRRCLLSDLRLRRGMVCFLQGVSLGREGYGPCDLALAWSAEPEAQPWYIATDEVASLHTLTEYGGRMDSDESFRDDKRGGFQWEDCELHDAPSISRLLLVMAVACLVLVCLGTTVVACGWRRMVDPHWGRGLSYFQTGWRFLRRHLDCARVWLGALYLSPDPDPAPVMLARARRAPPVWVECQPSDLVP
jgi:hypothetical protein